MSYFYCAIKLVYSVDNIETMGRGEVPGQWGKAAT